MAEPTSLLDEKVLTSPTLCEQPVESAVTSPVTSNSPVDIESGEPAENRPWLARWLSFRRTPTAAAIELQKQKERADAAVKATKTRSLDDSPKGYPQLACFLSSDGSFSLYRGFSYLHSRVLLQLQDELAALEKELDDVDNADRVEGRTKNLKARRYDEKNPRDEDSGYRSRKEILDDIHKKILEYDEVLMKSRDVMAMGRPSDRDYKSVRTWFWNNKPLADAKESDFIKKKEDVISLRHGREWSAFDGFVENALIRLNRCFKSDILRRLLCTPELRAKTNDRYLNYWSPSRVEKLIGLIITAVIFILLVCPVVIMYCLTSQSHNDPNSTFRAIGVLVVFTLLFSAAMSMLTKARRHELFAAAAAYCAVLVVFISNFSNN